MSLQTIDIAGFTAGVQKNKKPFLLVDDAFVDLQNAYVWRQELRKREGMQLIGRYRRALTNVTTKQSDGLAMTYTPPGIGEQTIDIFSIYSLSGTEPNPQIETGTIASPNIITLDPGGANETILTDSAGTGVLAITGGGPIISSAWIDYTTGIITAIFTAAPGALNVTLTIHYYPFLPAMGILVREIPGINDEQTIWFDTKYAYIHNGAEFLEYLPAEGATWNGTNSDFFWGANYRGSDSQIRLFFVTNFVPDALSPMRYTDGTTWEEFSPIVAGTSQTDVLTTTLAAGSVNFGPANLVQTPIIEGTVVITVTINGGGQDDIIFRDTPKDGTLVGTGSNSGTINYSTGAVSLSFSPALPGAANWTVTAVYDFGTSYLFSARILIPYYGRLVALNTWEGATVGGAVNIFNRARFSQIGSPVQQDAWRSDVFGKGGFVDAPVNEDIISATFYKNTLIVFFERSTWRLQYLGEYGIPFIWERISSDFGSESTFSPVLFDNGVLAVGDKAIVGSSGGDVQRIDGDIPDTVYDFKNSDEGVKRVHGIRDFKKELVYWCYPNFPIGQTGQFYPNKSLLYNYKNNTFAFFRNNVTCFGNFQLPVDVTWDRFDILWDFPVPWDSQGQSNEPVIVSGNQHGFAHFFNNIGVESASDSTIVALDQESLSVTAVTVTTVVTLTIPDHNLLSEEFIYLTGLLYLDTGQEPAVPGSTTLNDKIYMIQVEDKDNIVLFEWDIESQEPYNNFDVTNVGEYVGGGVVALFPRMEITTKDFNPVKQIGENIKTTQIDFLFDVSSPSPINVQLKMNTTTAVIGNLDIGNTEVETANSKTGFITDITGPNPVNTYTIESINHGLLTGNEVLFNQILGSTELNGKKYSVTFVSVNTFTIVETGAVSPYERDGYWEQSEQEYFTLDAEYAWHRFFATAFGQYIALILTYNTQQMFQLSTHQQNFVLNAIKIYFRPGGRNIFGK